MNSYNVGVLKSHHWEDHNLSRIFRSCLCIASSYPSEGIASRVTLTALRCHFVLSAIHLSQARKVCAEDKIGHYELVRSHVAQYHSKLRQSRPPKDFHIRRDLAAKLSTLLIYDFEAAIQLGQHSDLRGILAQQAALRQTMALKAMGDLLLQSSLPAERAYRSALLSYGWADIESSSVELDENNYQ